MDTSSKNTTIFRQSHMILLFRLLTVEIMLIFLYLIVRLPKNFALSPLLNTTEQFLINIAGIIYYAILTLSELYVVMQITLGWASEIYEINEGSIIHRKGIFKLNQDEFTLRNLSSANINQGLMGRIFNYGTIVLYSPVLKQEFAITNVHNPKELMKHLKDDITGKDQGSVIRRRV